MNEKTFFKIFVGYAIVILALLGFGVWVIIKLLKFWGVI